MVLPTIKISSDPALVAKGGVVSAVGQQTYEAKLFAFGSCDVPSQHDAALGIHDYRMGRRRQSVESQGAFAVPVEIKVERTVGFVLKNGHLRY